MSAGTSLKIWLIDPISYSGMAYTDVGQMRALQRLGARVLLVGSDSWMLDPTIVPRASLFRATHGSGWRVLRGANYIISLVRLVDRARRHRPDVVHWQFTEVPVADLLAIAVMRASGIPQAYTAHELLPWTASRHHRWLFWALYRLVDAVIVHSEAQRVELSRRFGVRSAKVHVAPLGGYALFTAPDLDQSDARAQLGLPPVSPVALFFGTLRPSKGLATLLDAWSQVVRAVPGAILMVVGKPYKGLATDDLVARIRTSGVEASIRTRFEQVDPTVTNLCYRAADVVVLPYDEIGTSGVLRYAYDSARPVVATSVGEHPTHVVHGETGSLVPPRDPDALAAELARVLADRALLREMGGSAARYAADHFDWLPSGRRLLAVYEDLTGRRPSERSSDATLVPSDQSNTRR